MTYSYLQKLIIDRIDDLMDIVDSKSTKLSLTDDIELLTDLLFYIQLYNEIEVYKHS